jgi:hypothetical protein
MSALPIGFGMRRLVAALLGVRILGVAGVPGHRTRHEG